MVFDVAGELVKQGVALDVITTLTVSLLAKVVDVNVAAVCPKTFMPFTFHWYVGAIPPLVGIAVNVTLDPEQMVVADAEMLTLACKFGLTLIVPVAFTEPQPPVKGIE